MSPDDSPSCTLAATGKSLLLLTVGFFVLGSLQAAQAQNEAACRRVVSATFGIDRVGNAPCRTLGVAVEDSLSTQVEAISQASGRALVREQLTPRDFQIPQGQVGNDAGTPAQGESAPSIQSVALAGGNIAAAGTEEGTRTLATAALNPASLFGSPEGDSQPDDSRTKDSLTVALSTLGDVTFIAPIEDVDTEEPLDYLGVRARLNVTSLTQGAPSFRKVENQWVKTLRASGEFLNRIIPVLRQTNNVPACTKALLRSPESGIQEASAACGADLNPLSLTPKDFAELRALTEEALAEADEEYFGLDLRLDLGDPTLGVADSARGTRLYTGVAWGHRYGEATSARTTIRLNGGVRFIDLDVMDKAVFAAEGGFGLAFSKIVEKQRLQGSAGLSFSAGNVGETFERAAETNYLRGQLSVSVPLAQNFGLSINFTTPIIGDVGTTLSVKTNWHLLLPGSN